MTVAAFLEAIRARGLNQKEAAIALGVTDGAVSLWVNGKRTIPDIVGIALKSIPAKRKSRTKAA